MDAREPDVFVFSDDPGLVRLAAAYNAYVERMIAELIIILGRRPKSL